VGKKLQNNASSKETEKVLLQQVKRTDNIYFMRSLMNILATITHFYLFQRNSGSYIRKLLFWILTNFLQRILT